MYSRALGLGKAELGGTAISSKSEYHKFRWSLRCLGRKYTSLARHVGERSETESMVRPCLRTGISGTVQQAMMDTQESQSGVPLGNGQSHRWPMSFIHAIWFNLYKGVIISPWCCEMMLWKCCTQYTSKFGKLCSGHRTERGQFSFQSLRKAMSKNAQTNTQLHSSHTIAK